MTDNRERPQQISTRPVLFLSCIFILLSGCVSLQQVPTTGIKNISSLNAFDGIYENQSSKKSGSEFSSLWNQLNLSEKPDTLDFSKARIGLKAVGKDQIKATWVEGGTEKKSIVLKGKLRDNYFVSRHKRTVIPIPLIYGQVKNNQFQLWLDKGNQLHADRLQNRWGWVFVFLASNDNTSSHEYKRKSE